MKALACLRLRVGLMLAIGLLSPVGLVGGLTTAAALGAPACQGIVELARQVKDDDARKRRKAVKGLAALGSYQAWAILMGYGLVDSNPMVADEAQLQLGKLRQPRTVLLMFGRHVLGHRDGLVRLRAAEALGRMETRTEAAHWLRALKDRDPRVRQALLASLGAQLRAAHIDGDLAQLTKAVLRSTRSDKTIDTRGTGLMTLASLDPQRARELALEFGKAEETGLRQASLATWMILDPGAALTHALAVIDDEQPGPRTAAVEVLAGVATLPAVEALVERLAHEARPKIVALIVDHLRALSGKRHGSNPAPWDAWLDGLPEDWSGAPSERQRRESRRDAQDTDGRTTTFAGHVVRSDRVAFLIDMSGSMWDEVDGLTRKARVEIELARALESLLATAKFNVLPYAGEPKPWEKRLVAATQRNVKKAIDRFERNKLRGQGNAWGAIELALEDPEVDTLVLLTDGSQTGGERWNVELLALLWAEKNRLHHVTLDVVLVGAKKPLVKYWRAVAASGGGRVVEVEL